LSRKDEDLLREGALWLSEHKDFSGIIYAHQLRITVGQMVEDRKSQSNRIYAGEVSGAEVESWWHQESIAGTETGRRRIS